MMVRGRSAYPTKLAKVSCQAKLRRSESTVSGTESTIDEIGMIAVTMTAIDGTGIGIGIVGTGIGIVVTGGTATGGIDIVTAGMRLTD